ncbi:MAG: transglycosylase SLT domain-containing protein [Burkholderiaceae bacterium]|nr:transglycosylase SLT domain-containing protein [Burkholderiaceae bacterium]
MYCRDREQTRLAQYRSPLAVKLRPAVIIVLVLHLFSIGFLLAVMVTEAKAAPGDQIPREAQQHQAALKRNAQMIWGLGAPVATFAAQVHQESRWRADARSPVGALGLAQFMPATAAWIGAHDPALLGAQATNPTWALRAVVSYDRWLWQRIKADDECQRMAFTLAAYNGGLGWVYKRQKASSQPGQCMGATCAINPGITPASQAENERYPKLILQRFEPLYSAWGLGSCSP